MSVQPSDPLAHLCHWYEYVIGIEPRHDPVVAEISCRCFAVPEIAGGSRLTGARRPTVAVSTDAADVEPAEFDATTTPRILKREAEGNHSGAGMSRPPARSTEHHGEALVCRARARRRGR